MASINLGVIERFSKQPRTLASTICCWTSLADDKLAKPTPFRACRSQLSRLIYWIVLRSLVSEKMINADGGRARCGVRKGNSAQFSSIRDSNELNGGNYGAANGRRDQVFLCRAQLSASIKANLIHQHQVALMAPLTFGVPYSLSPQLSFYLESEWEKS